MTNSAGENGMSRGATEPDGSEHLTHRRGDREVCDDLCLFRTIAEANLIGVGLGTLDGPVAYANDELLRMMGLSRSDQEAGQVDWNQRVAPECREKLADTLTRLRQGEVARCESVLLRPGRLGEVRSGARTPRPDRFRRARGRGSSSNFR